MKRDGAEAGRQPHHYMFTIWLQAGAVFYMPYVNIELVKESGRDIMKRKNAGILAALLSGAVLLGAVRKPRTL